MYIIAGLGNPTREYEKTRHNAGFEAIDILADKLGTRVTEKKHKAFCGSGMIGFEKVILAKPQTFMNLSGESIRAIADFYKVEPDHIIIICDDINLAEGRLRIRTKGSAGGHNGLKNIISHLGTQEFLRIRVGVGEKPEEMDLADYVLGRFPKDQEEVMAQAYKDAAEAAVMMVTDGADMAMNHFNRKK
ncbi:aminoacyl-tRNA hydrolase [Clostridium sp. Marseille-P2415]|uniref:aminoacyl-tRNA hydrolase n=1 Tax=Clostridium sp. Marseille-P2415 TaxID=1805471 RepID=UPI0009886A58|nr:aminoacyl-tRNA hydrolase [Clostridium sp. Marseille-P2415]